ncbi:hypothetical protein [Sedimenticola selenatireducens]|uniref:hypothetical protein n=1 Tax=Sedimenticola selenatireducens TaxID=191960 RepID=UPI002AAC3C2E|nr:hypothetical protein [Sedimenticola selenatireducens]
MAIPKYTDIVNLIKKGSTLEAQEKIMELREACLELQEENHVLKSKISSLEKELEFKADLTFDGVAYWLNKKKTDGPICQPCYDSKGLSAKLHESTDFAGQPAWWCTVCKTTFTK